MISRDRVIKALTHNITDRVPVEIDPCLPEFVSDVGYPEYAYGRGKSSGEYGKKGCYIDQWGCVWECGEDGVKGEVKTGLLADWSALRTFKIPMRLLNDADLSTVNDQCEKSDKFMIHMWGTEPFQRMQYLRGTENLFLDLAYGDAKVFQLMTMVHEFFLKEVDLWANTNVDGIHIEDDWGTQRALLISPAMWREYFKPLYKDYCDIAHKKGKFVVMHSDGNISEIIPDLIEIGVNAINAQLDCMDIDHLVASYHGKIAFWGGFDRQYLLPFGTQSDVREEVQRLGNTFFQYGKTGVIGQCFRDKDAKEENVRAVYDEWLKF